MNAAADKQRTSGAENYVYASNNNSNDAPITNKKSIEISGKAYFYDGLYYTISEMSGGQIFTIKKYEIGALAELTDILTSNYHAGIMSIGGKLVDDASNSHTFKVDSMIEKISISISFLNNVSITVQRPDGSIVGGNDMDVDIIALSSSVAYQVNKPATGTWKINIQGKGAYNINVAGNSPISFDDLKFVEYGGRPAHQGFFEIDGFPLAGNKQVIEATISNTTSDVRFEFRAKDGSILDSLLFDTVDTSPSVKTVFLKRDVILPSHDFLVYAFGKDANGNNFERVLAKTITPQTIGVVGPGNGSIPSGQDTVYTFRVTNYGAAGNYTFDAVDDQNFMTGMAVKSATIASGGSVDVQVILNPGLSAVGTTSTLTFLAAPANVYSVLGNFATCNITVSEEKSKAISMVQGMLIKKGAAINEKGSDRVSGRGIPAR